MRLSNFRVPTTIIGLALLTGTVAAPAFAAPQSISKTVNPELVEKCNQHWRKVGNDDYAPSGGKGCLQANWTAPDEAHKISCRVSMRVPAESNARIFFGFKDNNGKTFKIVPLNEDQKRNQTALIDTVAGVYSVNLGDNNGHPNQNIGVAEMQFNCG